MHPASARDSVFEKRFCFRIQHASGSPAPALLAYANTISNSEIELCSCVALKQLTVVELPCRPVLLLSMDTDGIIVLALSSAVAYSTMCVNSNHQ